MSGFNDKKSIEIQERGNYDKSLGLKDSAPESDINNKKNHDKARADEHKEREGGKIAY